MAQRLYLELSTKVGWKIVGEFVKPKHIALISLIVLIFTSVAALAGNHLFKFSDNPGFGRIVFHLDNGKDKVFYHDANGQEKLLLEGKILALTQSSEGPNEGITTVRNGEEPVRVRLTKLGRSLPIANLDNQFYVFDVDGTVWPLPHQTDPALFDSLWDTDVYLADDENNQPARILVVSRTDFSEKSIETKTTLTLIKSPQGTYTTRLLSTTLQNPFKLGEQRLFLPGGSFIFARDAQTVFKGSDNQPMKPIPFDDFKSIQSECADLKLFRQKALVAYKNGDASSLAELKRIRADMEKTSIGQPEGVQAFYDLEMNKYIHGENRTDAPNILLMGLPATGKDTLVHAYVDAIWNEKGAWKNNKHMFEMPILKDKHQLWTLLGSTAGLIGSDTLSEFTKFLVAHSGGKYKITTVKNPQGNKVKSFVELNPEWKPGMVLPNYFPPSKAVIFCNELHNWSKEVKDEFLKRALDGVVILNNPDDGESNLSIPVTWVLASNEGSNLIIPRKANGEQVTSRPLTYDEQFRNWDRNRGDERRLDNELAKTTGGTGVDALGNSDALIRRLNKVLLRPLSPESLREIVNIKLNDLAVAWSGNYNLQWDADFVKTIQEFNYNPEKNAGGLDLKIKKMVESPLFQAVVDEKLHKGAQKTLRLSFTTHKDHTLSLALSGESKEFEMPIPYTESVRVKPIKTDEELESLATLGERLKKHVFGADRVADELAKDLLVTQESENTNLTPETAKDPARTYMFLGPSSTGKTEMGKALGLEFKHSRDAAKTFDYSQVTHKEHVKEKILGVRDSLNRPIASDYMLEYDARGGQMIALHDEAANAPLEVLKALYDIIREPVGTTYSDNVPRVHSGIINIFTGNAGEEWYAGIPGHLPFNMQMAAMQQIYKRAMANPAFRRRTLEKYFSSAFIARVGEQNIFWFAPLSFKAIRELGQLKLTKELRDMETAEGRRTWKIEFATMDDYVKTLEMIETEGFVVKEQGASIDRFVKQNIISDLRAFLLKNKVPDKAHVILKKGSDSVEKEKGYVTYNVIVNGKDSGKLFQIEKRIKEHALQPNEEDQILTAFHEAGHELARKVLFGDHYKAQRISIIPGVAEIGEQMIVYAGIAVSEQVKAFQYTHEAVMRDLAVKLAGTAAQEMVSRNFVHDSGKANDLEQAIGLAQFAILKWGLSKKWGSASVPQKMSVNEYLASLSNERKKIYEEALHEMLTEAKLMADSVVLTNSETLITLGTELAERGEMGEGEISEFYQKRGSRIDYNGFARLMKSPEDFKTHQDKWADPHAESTRPMSAVLSSHVPRPKKIADLQTMVAVEKAAELAQVKWADHLPVANWQGEVSTPVNGTTEKASPKTPEQGQDHSMRIKFSFNGMPLDHCNYLMGQIHHKKAN